MKYSIFIAFWFFVISAFGQDYNVSLIPDTLKTGANAVKRYEALRVVIKSPSRAVITHKWAITILNKEGERFSGYVNSYSKLFALNSIDGYLYDAEGKRIKSVKKKDISDLSYNDDMSLMTDDRIKAHNFYYSSFPYTVEYEDEMEYDGLFFLPKWQPIRTDHISLQKSELIVETLPDYKIRYKQLNFHQQPVISGAARLTYQWQLQNLPAMEEEDYQPDWDDVTPSVLLGATSFEFGGYKGDMSSWQSLGSYLSTLYSGRDQLPEKVKADIKQLTANVADTREKVKLIYEYLQQNTRYISIQLGIGGWQPFDASFVANKKYGDCKALSNYMVSMLKEAGIKSNHVIINSGEGERGLYEDFPAPYFNHVIMCVPLEKDTIWLECTSQTKSPGYMGKHTGNRKALLLAEDGGYVVSTPSYSAKDNLQLRKINAVIDAQGNLSVEVRTRFTGEQQELPHALIHYFNQEQRQKYLNERISLPTYKVEASDYKEFKATLPVVDEYLRISAPSYASITGKRLFIQPNIFNKQGVKAETGNQRSFPMKFDFSFRDVDTIHINIPEGYSPEAVPKDVSLSSKWGKYSISFQVNGNSIDVLRVSERNSGTYPASDFTAFAGYMADVYKADRSKIVFVKKE